MMMQRIIRLVDHLRLFGVGLVSDPTDIVFCLALALLPAGGTSATDLAVELNGMTYQACRGDFVVRLDGSTCLQLWNKEGRVVRREGDPLEVAQWLQACHDAGMEVRVQINESAAP